MSASRFRPSRIARALSRSSAARGSDQAQADLHLRRLPHGARPLVGHRLGDLLGRGRRAPGEGLGEGERTWRVVRAGLAAWSGHGPSIAQVGSLPGRGMSDEPAARAVLVERLFALLHDCRALVPQLEAGGGSESMSAQAELAALAKEAHEQICPYSYDTRGNVPVDFTVVEGGRPDSYARAMPPSTKSSAPVT